MTIGVKLTNEEVIERIKYKFPEYDCSRVLYVGAKLPVIIGCPKHGWFSRESSKGYECQKCSLERRTKSQRSNKDEFVDKAVKTHGNKYDYSLFEYKTARIPGKIRCTIHDHVFEQAPYVHLATKGCSLCRNDKLAKDRSADNAHFIKRSIEYHGDKFTFEKLNYVNAKTKVTLGCKVEGHGDFPTIPSNHWLGAACPLCSEAGFSCKRPAILYVFNYENITKIGISNSQVVKRLKCLQKETGKNFEIVKTYKSEDGLLINNTETQLLHQLREIYKQPNFKFDGYSECFYDVDIPHLLNMIEQKLGVVNDK
jgi:hypothetical protein